MLIDMEDKAKKEKSEDLLKVITLAKMLKAEIDAQVKPEIKHKTIKYRKTITYYLDYDLDFEEFKTTNLMEQKRNEDDEEHNKRCVEVWNIMCGKNTIGDFDLPDEEIHIDSKDGADNDLEAEIYEWIENDVENDMENAKCVYEDEEMKKLKKN